MTSNKESWLETNVVNDRSVIKQNLDLETWALSSTADDDGKFQPICKYFFNCAMFLGSFDFGHIFGTLSDIYRSTSRDIKYPTIATRWIFFVENPVKRSYLPVILVKNCLSELLT